MPAQPHTASPLPDFEKPLLKFNFETHGIQPKFSEYTI